MTFVPGQWRSRRLHAKIDPGHHSAVIPSEEEEQRTLCRRLDLYSLSFSAELQQYFRSLPLWIANPRLHWFWRLHWFD